MASELEAAGYRVIIQAWDFVPGTDWAAKMEEAATTAARVVPILTDAYLGSKYGKAEWLNAWADDPDGSERRVIPVKVGPAEPQGYLKTRVAIDVVGKDVVAARKLLLDGVKEGRGKPATAPPFPGGPSSVSGGGSSPRFPGSGPKITNLPARNPNFTGREDLLEKLRQNLLAGSSTSIVQAEAIHGLGGVGKTQLAIEYAHRYSASYDLIWWVAAEHPTAAVASLTTLGTRLGLPNAEPSAEPTAPLFDYLRGQQRWLLIYDNAERPSDVQSLIPPGGSGDVIVTSRWSAWGNVGTSVPLGVLTRDESVAFLRKRTDAADDQQLDRLAELLGDLPIALEEAAAYLEETREDVKAYGDLVEERAEELFGLDAANSEIPADQRRVATVWSVSLERLRSEAPTAEALLNICAFVAPDDIPRSLFRDQADKLPEPLAAAARDRIAYNRMLAAIARYSMASVTSEALDVHRLVQSVIRARLSEREEVAALATAVALIVEALPDAQYPAKWTEWRRLLPHALTVAGNAAVLHPDASVYLLTESSDYLRRTGNAAQAVSVARRAREIATDSRAADFTIARAAHLLAMSVREVGDPQGALSLHHEAVASFARASGEEHPNTLIAMNQLAFTLFELEDYAAARATQEKVVEASTRVLGETAPDTLIAMNNLASMLSAEGEYEAARDISARVLATRRQVSGAEDRETLVAMNNLAASLGETGDLEGARALLDEAIAIEKRVLGEDHPDTLSTTINLAATVRLAGDRDRARRLLERVVARADENLADAHPLQVRAKLELADVLMVDGKIGESRTLLEEALTLGTATLSDGHPYLRKLKESIAVVSGLEQAPSADEPRQDSGGHDIR